MTNLNLKILFCGILKSPFILQDLKLLKQYYNIKVINFDIINDKREGIFYFLWSLLTKDIYTIYKSDVIYIWFADYYAIPLIFFSKIFNKPSLVNIGGWEVSAIPEIKYGNQLNLIRGAVSRWVVRNATICIVPSESYKNVVKNLINSANVVVIPNWVDSKICNEVLPDKKDIIITACWAEGAEISKGVHIFREVAKLVSNEMRVLTRLPRKEYIQILKEAKVYCQLSYNEAFGISLLEAMAYGCIPVITDRGALPWIVGDSGIVVPYGDIEKTKEAILLALKFNLSDVERVRERSKYFTCDNKIKILSDILENGYIDIPLVSVVIPSYNSAQWLPDTIGSILNQTYPNIEIIVVDDCSTDNTYEIISKFSMVKYLKNYANMGECFSSRRGFDEARGYYICRLSADDMYANPNKIKHQVEVMERTGIDWSYNNINCVGKTLETAKIFNYFWMPLPTRYAHKILLLFDNYILKFPYFVFIRMFFGNPINSSTLMFRKSSYMRSAKWTDGNQRTDCDGLLLYNLFLDNFKCVAIQELGSFYRIHPEQATNISKRYLGDVRDNKIEAINKVLTGKYPLWLKCAVKILRRRI